MAVILIQSLEAPIFFDAAMIDISDVYDEISFAPFVGQSIVVETAYKLTNFTNTFPITEPQRNASPFYKSTSFFDDYYNRIIITPSIVDVGNVISDTIETIEVWNGYLTPRLLSAIAEIGTTGLTRSGPVPPSSWAGLQSKSYSITVTINGPPDIKAQYFFDWSGGVTDDSILQFTGTRVIGLAYQFEAPALETLEWRTDVLISNNGSEQRIRQRKAPRQELKIKYPLQYVDMQAAQNRAYGWVGRRWIVPMWNEAQKVSTLSAGATTITVPTDNVDFRAGGLAFIHSSNALSASVNVTSAVGGVVTLDEPLSTTFPNPFVMPARLGRVLGNIERTFNGHNGSLGFNFQIRDNIDLGIGTTPTQYLGHDVYTDEVLLGDDDTTEAISRRIDLVDYENGVVDIFSPWLNTRVRRPSKYIIQGLPAIWTFRKWLHRRGGKQRPFWLPTFENDFRIQQTLSITTTITVYADDYILFSPERKHIAILLNDSVTWFFREITSLTDLGGGLISISLDSSVGGILPSAIRSISFLGLKRLDTDRVELNWETNRTLTTTIPILEIQP